MLVFQIFFISLQSHSCEVEIGNWAGENSSQLKAINEITIVESNTSNYPSFLIKVNGVCHRNPTLIRLLLLHQLSSIGLRPTDKLSVGYLPASREMVHNRKETVLKETTPNKKCHRLTGKD